MLSIRQLGLLGLVALSLIASSNFGWSDDPLGEEIGFQVPTGGARDLLTFIADLQKYRPPAGAPGKEAREKKAAALSTATKRLVAVAKPQDRSLPGYDEAHALYWKIRVDEAHAPDEVRKVCADIKKYFADNRFPDPKIAELVIVLAESDTLPASQATALLKDISSKLAKHRDPELALIGERMIGRSRFVGLKAGNAMLLSGTTIDGRKFANSHLKGKVVLVDFWATWCGPCMQEMPNILRNYEKYHDKGFEVVSVNLDEKRVDLDKYLSSERVPWIVLYDGPWAENPITQYYGISTIPTAILLDRNGKGISTTARGPELGKLLEQLLAEKSDKKK